MMMNMKMFVKTGKGMKIPWESKALFRQLATVLELKKLIINFFLVARAKNDFENRKQILVDCCFH